MMTSTKRIIPIALVAALLGGSVGAFVMRGPKTPETANNTTTAAPTQAANTTTTDQALTASNEESRANLSPEQAAFRDGFEAGFLSARENGATAGNSSSIVNRIRSVGNRTNEQQAYNHYTQRQPQTRSFWQKHRDKLTVAAGTGGGALIGGLFGGKKGALIGGLAGAGGSALYTYKLRKKTPKY
jgi:hypothetical protein